MEDATAALPPPRASIHGLPAEPCVSIRILGEQGAHRLVVFR